MVRMLSSGDTQLPLDVRPDCVVFTFTAAVSLATVALFGATIDPSGMPATDSAGENGAVTNNVRKASRQAITLVYSDL